MEWVVESGGGIETTTWKTTSNVASPPPLALVGVCAREREREREGERARARARECVCDGLCVNTH